MNEVSPVERNSSEIKRDLRLRRSELQENLKQLFRGRKAGAGNSNPPSGPVAAIGRIGNGATMPVLSIAAGAALVGVYLLRRRLWPLRLAGRFVGLAVPVVVPVLLRRVAGRESAN